MSHTIDLFVGAEAPLPDLRNAIESAAHARFVTNVKGEPVIRFQTARLFLESGHRFDDDSVQWPDGTWIKLGSEYPYWIEIRDIDRDLYRQMETARSLFLALERVGRWRLVLVDDMQTFIDSFDPPEADGSTVEPHDSDCGQQEEWSAPQDGASRPHHPPPRRE